VILSFENYCGIKMQEKMKKYMLDSFGDKLLREPLEEYPIKPGVKLPSPEELKYKILCKFRNKKLSMLIKLFFGKTVIATPHHA
jgi:phosphatidylinositol phospholipase C, beta